MHTLFSRSALALALPALVLLGAGCREAGNALGDQAAAPITAPVAALGQSKEALAEAQASKFREAESVSDDVSVAFIVTENAKAPATAQVMPDAIGCNDRVAFVKRHRAASSNEVVRDALQTMLAVRETSPDGLYNALAMSSLAVDDVRSPDGVTTEVRLKGKIESAGACDTPRIKAQVESVIARFRPKYKVLLNGSESAWRCFGDESGLCK